jgi:pimeloyl-ACP methyl ester carboxylesterase
MGASGSAHVPDDLPAAGTYEYKLIKPPTLLIVGEEDHVVPLGQYTMPEEATRLGDFVGLSAAAVDDIPRGADNPQTAF